MQIKQLIPPIVSNAIWRLGWAPKVYECYRDAVLACGDDGYQREAVLDIVYEKTRRHRDVLLIERPAKVDQTSVRTYLALSLARNGGAMNVIDFGGACGAHYFTAKALFGDRLRLSWYVVETAGMLTRGRQLENDELKFVDSLPAATSTLGEADLLFSDSVLQYLPSPYDTLEQLTACGAKNIFLTRLGLTTSAADIVCVQKSPFAANGPGPLPVNMKDGIAKYPVTFARRDRVEEVLSQRYNLLARFDEERGAYQLAGQSIGMYGYFCDLRKPPACRSSAH